MSDTDDELIKTTVYLAAGDYRRLQAMAREQDTSAAFLVRDAVSAYAQRHRPRPKARSVGIGHSGRGDLSERADELLRGMGRRRT